MVKQKYSLMRRELLDYVPNLSSVAWVSILRGQNECALAPLYQTPLRLGGLESRAARAALTPRSGSASPSGTPKRHSPALRRRSKRDLMDSLTRGASSFSSSKELVEHAGQLGSRKHLRPRHACSAEHLQHRTTSSDVGAPYRCRNHVQLPKNPRPLRSRAPPNRSGSRYSRPASATAPIRRPCATQAAARLSGTPPRTRFERQVFNPHTTGFVTIGS